MRLKKEVSKFSASCEHLMAEAEAGVRKLTDEESLLVEYYCLEVLKKVIKRRPPQQQASAQGDGTHSIPPSDPKNRTISPSAPV